jgi:hypothetical protein
MKTLRFHPSAWSLVTFPFLWREGNVFIYMGEGTPRKLATATQPQFPLPFPQFALLHSVTCVQLRLITILVSCGCQFPWCALALKGRVDPRAILRLEGLGQQKIQ